MPSPRNGAVTSARGRSATWLLRSAVRGRRSRASSHGGDASVSFGVPRCCRDAVAYSPVPKFGWRKPVSRRTVGGSAFVGSGESGRSDGTARRRRWSDRMGIAASGVAGGRPPTLRGGRAARRPPVRDDPRQRGALADDGATAPSADLLCEPMTRRNRSGRCCCDHRGPGPRRPGRRRGAPAGDGPGGRPDRPVRDVPRRAFRVSGRLTVRFGLGPSCGFRRFYTAAMCDAAPFARIGSKIQIPGNRTGS